MLFCLIGKNECQKTRNEDFLADMNDVMTERDCDKALKAEFYM